jgi:hypothetical protein
MPEYHNRDWERAAALERTATGPSTWEPRRATTATTYVRDTVLFATVLFLTAVGQRFRVKGPRIALLGVSMVLLVVALYFVATYPAAP